MSIDLSHIQQTFNDADVLYNQAQIEAALDRMAAEISKQLSDKNPLLYCVMNGGLITMGHLLPRLGFPLQSSYLHATRYRNTTEGGKLDWKVLPEEDLSGRTIVIVDDILDEGHTLSAIMDYCKEKGAKEVLSAILLNKHHDRKANKNLKADFFGLDIEDRYVFGFGLDYQGYWRNAPGIYALKNT